MDRARLNVVLGTNHASTAHTMIALTMAVIRWRAVKDRLARPRTTNTPMNAASSAVREPDAQTAIPRQTHPTAHAAARYLRPLPITIATVTGSQSAIATPNGFASRIVPTTRP